MISPSIYQERINPYCHGMESTCQQDGCAKELIRVIGKSRRISVVCSMGADLAKPWGECKMEECIAIGVNANETITYCVGKM